jgi:hypothetical protein
MDSTAAKQFLISKIIEEAEREHLSLSEIEKKMLHFTEVHPSLPDIYEVGAEFERDYDSDEYEAKIAGLLKMARDHDRQSPDGDRLWNEALDSLKKEDHYILVMTSRAFGSALSLGRGSRLRDFLIYVAVGLGLVLIAFLASVWRAGH